MGENRHGNLGTYSCTAETETATPPLQYLRSIMLTLQLGDPLPSQVRVARGGCITYYLTLPVNTTAVNTDNMSVTPLYLTYGV